MPQLPRRRRSIRLRDYDYRTPAACFLAICTHDGRLLFTDPALRQLAEDTWASLPDHHGVTADVFVVMPNHIDGILSIWGQVGALRPYARFWSKRPSAIHYLQRSGHRPRLPSAIGPKNHLPLRMTW